ncbi:carboxypeptidase-like regulatory domain-containing protein [uncultured Bacteroides sp.]|uniref:carboxypeptidase-like regulatory domain-containing protein n=1 Tax=uncultured Bacteroides sp. TaxID=162156 RepID=UPI002AA718DC|nr:carboxypeptidase-like regulatory domain-containing protein [uncultured Bacteroides sp.]
MKTLFKSIGFLLLLTFLSSMQFEAVASDVEYYTINGIVKDSQTKKKLEYVSVSIPGSSTSTISNVDGEFSLKVKVSADAREMEISHVGYLSSRIPISKSEQTKTYYLQPNAYLLKEVVIQPELARSLVEQAVSKIETNYSPASNMFNCFYRETVQKGKRYIQVSEAILNLYKEPYSKGIDKDRVRIFKGRKLVSQNQKDTLAVKLMGGPYMSVLLDVVKNKDILLDKEMLSSYTYTLEDPVNLDNRPQYVISFRPAVTLPYALYFGKYYIDKETLTFSRVEFSLDLRDRDKAITQILVKKPLGLRFKPLDVNFLITYKVQNGISYMNYMRTESQFNCDWKKRLFKSKYTVLSEVVATERDDAPKESIPYKESFKYDQAFTDKVSDFSDNDFWGGYNVIAPTESLLDGLNKLKKQYH